MEDAKTVRYVSKDNIQNLKIRVTLTRLSTQTKRANVRTPEEVAAAQGQPQPQPQAPIQGQPPSDGPQQQPPPQSTAPPAQGLDAQPQSAPLPLGSLTTNYPQPGPELAANVATHGLQTSAPGPYPPPQYAQGPPQQQLQQLPQQQYYPQQQQYYPHQQMQPQPYTTAPFPPTLQPQNPAGQPVGESAVLSHSCGPLLGPAAGSPGPPLGPQQLTGNTAAASGRPDGTTRQRMSVRQRLDAAATAGVGSTLTGMPTMTAPGGAQPHPTASSAAAEGSLPYGVASRQRVTAATRAGDPFAAAAAVAAVWGGGGGGWAGQVQGYGLNDRHGQPLGEALERPDGEDDPSGGGGDYPGVRRRRQRRQGLVAGADTAVDTAAAIGQEGGEQPDRTAPINPQAQQPDPQAQAPYPQPTMMPALAPQVGLTAGSGGGVTGVSGTLTIPPQPVPPIVQYGSLGAEARMAALGQAQEVPPTTPPSQLPEKYKTARVFSWQEKVYSRTELAAAQDAAAASRASPGGPAPPHTPPLQSPGPPVTPPQQQAGTGAGGQGAPTSKRQHAFGSQSTLANKQLDPRTPGSLLYSYVQSDPYCLAAELERSVTTSQYEEENMLVSKLLNNPKGRQQVLSFRSMFIMADLGAEGDVGASNDKVLVFIRSYPDGSFDMCPGFSKPGFKYRFEDKHGGIYEYTVEHASASDAPSLDRRTAKLERAVVARAEELRRAAMKSDFEQPPASGCTRLLLLGEMLAAADFPLDRLYLEYVVRWDPDTWELTGGGGEEPGGGGLGAQEPGIATGVTDVSRVTLYPADPATDTPSRYVAHFAHPLELEWTSRGLGAGGKGQGAEDGSGAGEGGQKGLSSNRFPALFFQVCSLDRFNRYTCQGYGWLPLEGRVPGSGTHVIRTWKPLGTIRDRQAEFFVGGSPELADLAYMATPTGFNGRILNKYGFKTDTVGAIKVRIHTVIQRYDPDEGAVGRWGRGSSPTPARGGSASQLAQAPSTKRNTKKELSLKMVVERARQRLREARGTDELPNGEVGVRPGVVAEAPTILTHPQDAVVTEESTARFKVVARGLPPLKYEWFKDDRRLLTATADKPELILVQVGLDSEGAYYCQVSNRDGSVNSSRAILTVSRAARVSRASVGAGAGQSGEARRAGSRRLHREGDNTSPSGSVGGAGPSGGVGRPRISRLSRLDAAVGARVTASGGAESGQLSPTAPSQTSGGSAAGGPSGTGVGSSPAQSDPGSPTPAPAPPPSAITTIPSGPNSALLTVPTSPTVPQQVVEAAARGAPGPQEMLPSIADLLPPPPGAHSAPGTGETAGGEAGSGGGGSNVSGGGGLPASVAAAASSGFRRRPVRMPTDSAGGGGASWVTDSAAGGPSAASLPPPPTVAPRAAAVVSAAEEVQDMEEVQEVVGASRLRWTGSGGDRPAAAAPAPQPQQQQPPPQRPPQRRRADDDDDLEAEEID